MIGPNGKGEGKKYFFGFSNTPVTKLEIENGAFARED